MSANIENAARKTSKHGLIPAIVSTALPILVGCMVALYISIVCSYEIVVRASINGVPVGYVKSGSLFTHAELALEADISEKANFVYDMDVSVSYDIVYVKNPSYLTAEDCYRLLWARVSDDFTTASMLYIDGRQAVACENGDALRALIEEIEGELLESGGENFSTVRISNSLRIKEQLCPNDLLYSIDEINALLNPLAEENETVALSEEEKGTAEAPIILRVSAYASASPELVDETKIANPDIDYGVNRSFGEAAEIENGDLTLDYTFVNTTVREETIYYTTEYVSDYTHFIGTDTVATEGMDGKKRVTYELSYDSDGNLVSRTAVEEEILTPVQNKIVMVGAKEIPDAVPTGTFIWPCEAPKGVSSGYGWREIYGKKEFHLGIDLPDEKGSPIWASDGGEIVWAGFTPSYGYSIRIQHNDGYMTVYAHLSELMVSVGDHVYQGQQIGKMGSTGASYGSHLHFEVRIGSTTYDPLKYLPTRVTD